MESTPYISARLNLPESFTGGRTYQVQYGRRLVFDTAGEQTTTLRVPAGAFVTATLDALISEAGSGSLTFRLDIGDDGSWDWEWTGNVDNATTLSSPDLAVAFSCYWATHGVPTSGTVDVPVKVSLSKGGQVLLTNLQMTPTGSRVRYARLPAQDYGGVTLDLNIGESGSGSLVAAADVGDNGTLDWTYTGSPSYPDHLTTANLASAFNAYLAGHSGEMDVPVRFYLVPVLSLGLDDVDAKLLAQPDLSFAAADIAFGVAQPTEGQTVPITGTVHNDGSLNASGFVAAFFAGDPAAGGIYLGADYVPATPQGGVATAILAWDTEGLGGDVDIYVVLDPLGRVAETDEDNNVAFKPIHVKSRADLQVTSLTTSQPYLRVGRPVTVTAAISNAGETDSGVFTVAFYAEGGGRLPTTLIATATLTVAGQSTATVSAPWTPTTLGQQTLRADLDTGEEVGESNETNNEGTADVYVGWGDPLYVDAGGAGDPAYDPAAGYGYLTAGTVVSCGTEPHQTYRREASGSLLQYRFDHLLPGRFYHLDLTFFLCSGSDRILRVLVDGVPAAQGITASTTGSHTVSLLLDPGSYADHSIVVSIEKTGGGLGGPVVSEITLTDVRYCYRDSGRPGGEAAYAGAPDGCGWLDGDPDQSWGLLPHETVRFDDDGDVQYRFDGLETEKAYRLLLTFYEEDAAGRVQSVEVDGETVATGVNLSSAVQTISPTVPPATYQIDGSIVVAIRGPAQPVVSEIALEEVTLLEEASVGQVALSVDLQGRGDESGTEVSAWSGAQQAGSCTTDSSGACQMPLPAGSYRLTAGRTSYLTAEQTGVAISAGQTLEVAGVTLRGGDANTDCAVNILDLARMGSRFGSHTGDPNWDLPSDINGDGVLNILDLTIAGSNFGRVCPTAWTASRHLGSALNGAAVTLAPSPLTVAVGLTGTVAISVAGAPGLYGAETHLTFNPRQLRVMDANPAQAGVQVALGNLLSPDYVAQNRASNVTGTIDIALTQLSPTLPSGGVGALATITFQALLTGTAPISFTEVILADSEGEAIPAEVQNGRVIITDWERVFLPLVLRG